MLGPHLPNPGTWVYSLAGITSGSQASAIYPLKGSHPHNYPEMTTVGGAEFFLKLFLPRLYSMGNFQLRFKSPRNTDEVLVWQGGEGEQGFRREKEERKGGTFHMIFGLC